MKDQFTHDPAPKEPWSNGEKSHGSRRWTRLALMFVAAICVVAVIGWRSMHKAQAASAAAVGNPGRRAIPVLVSVAEKKDLPVYLNGLGSVEAFNTVTIKSRVDGQLVEIDFKEGQEVKKGDLLAVIDPRPFQAALSQAEGTLARDQAQLSDAMLNTERDQELVKEGVIAQQQYDTQHAQAGQLSGVVSADEAQIENAKLNLTFSRITAPIDGRVGLRLVDVGNMVHASDQTGLLVITQMQPITVVFTLPEDNLPAVIGKMKGGSLGVDAMSRDDGTKLASGKLLTVDNQIDQTTGTVKLKAIFSNDDRLLWPNQFVNARMLLDVKKDSTLIPAAAVQTGTQGSFVYAVKAGKSEAQPVTVGLTEGNVVDITSGIAPGDQVVTDGQDKLQSGMAVDPRVEGAAQPAAAAGGGRQGRNRAAGQATGATETAPTGAQSLTGGRRRGGQNASGGNPAAQ